MTKERNANLDIFLACFYYFQRCFNAKLWNIYKLCVLKELIQKGVILVRKKRKTIIAVVSVTIDFLGREKRLRK